MGRIKRFIISKKWWLIILAVLLLGGFGWSKIQAKNVDSKAKTIVLKKSTLKDILSFSGEIDAEQKATVRFQTSGRLAWVGVKEGDYVKKYQMLATLDQREVKNRLSQYLNTYSKTRWDFEQTAADNKDWQVNGMSDQARDSVKRIVEKSQFDLNNSVLNVELQDLALEYSKLWTPIEGLVTKVDAPDAGLNITPTGAEFSVVNPKSIYFVATADQSEVTKIKVGMEGEISLDSYPDEKLMGKIVNIGFVPRSGESSIVYEIKIPLDFDNSEYKYRLGMTGDISFVMSEKADVLALPSKYIKTEGGKKYVWVQKNGNKEKVYVELGENIDGNIEIKSGLAEGAVIYD